MKKILVFIMMVFVVISLYACGQKTYEVKFDLNYENAVNVPSTQKIKDGEKATEPIEPTREGYRFLGWYEDKDGNTKYDFSKEVSKDLVLYAKWEEENITKYYLAGNFSNYEPDDENYLMELNDDGLYTITVELTEENRDQPYDGHYYKVTNGTWDVDGTWGTDNYYIDPAPVSPTGGGLGSIWHWANGTLTVTFDPVTKLITDTLIMSEEIIKENEPTIYGKFNNWVTEGDDAFVLTDLDGDGIYTCEIEFTEAGESDFTIVVSHKWYDDQWGQRWGAFEQYKLDGTPAVMGDTSNITYEAGKYIFVYSSYNHITTYFKLESDEETYEVKFDLNYENAVNVPSTQKIKDGEKATEPIKPTREGYRFLGWYEDKDGNTKYDFSKEVSKDLVLYAKWEEENITKYYLAGYFSNYEPDDENYLMELNDDGLYTITVELTEENRDQTYDGHYYKVTNGTWDVDGTWGTDNYYIDPAPVSPTGGGLGSIWHWANGTLTVTFDPVTKLITDTLIMSEEIIEPNEPTIYGKFNNWVTKGDDAFVLIDLDGDGIYTCEIEFTEAGESDFTIVVSHKWYDDQWGQRWGAFEQYKLDGTPAGMGDSSEFEYEAGIYIFAYDSETNITTITIKD